MRSRVNQGLKTVSPQSTKHSKMDFKEKYSSYRELKQGEKEGRDYLILSRQGTSGIAVMAPHGGGIEPGTSEIANRVAGDEHAFYSFEGLKQTDCFDLHITSKLFDEPGGVDIAKNSRTILAIHGCKGKEHGIYIGGRDTTLKEKLKNTLIRDGFSVQENSSYPGMDPLNICNRSRFEKGVQMEVSIGLRRLMFSDLSRTRQMDTTQLFEKFVTALRRVLSDHH